VRDGKPSQVTTDHTVAEVLVIEGKLTIEEAQVSPLRTILVNAIGVSAEVGVEMAHVQLRKGDRLLLCSDGLHDYFPVDEEIGQRLASDKVGDAIAEMVELAKTRGGHDNITGIAIQVVDVVEAVPHAVDGESTQPVELPNSTAPFAADETTETAFVPPGGLPVRLTGGTGAPPAMPAAIEHGRPTQPMRTVTDAAAQPSRQQVGRADTWPPKGMLGLHAQEADGHGEHAAGAGDHHPHVDDESAGAKTEVMGAVSVPPELAASAGIGDAKSAPAGAEPKGVEDIGQADTGPVTPVDKAAVAEAAATAPGTDDDASGDDEPKKSKGSKKKKAKD
jgi:hypothetical protein